MFAIAVLSLDDLNGDVGLANEGEKALLCPQHIVQQTTFSTLLYDHTHRKNKIQLSTLYQKSKLWTTS